MLPAELLVQICGHLTEWTWELTEWPRSFAASQSTDHLERDLRSLRLTCREIAAKCLEAHAKLKFTSISVSLTHENLRLLLQQSKNKLVANCTRRIDFRYDCVNEEFVRELIAHYDNRRGRDDYYRKHARAVVHAEEERLHRRSGLHSTLLGLVFNNLPKLNSVSIESHHYSAGTIDPKPNSTPFATWGFQAILSSLSTTDTSLDSLRLAEDLNQLGRDVQYRHIQRRVHVASDLKALRSLRTLHLLFEEGKLLRSNLH